MTNFRTISPSFRFDGNPAQAQPVEDFRTATTQNPSAMAAAVGRITAEVTTENELATFLAEDGAERIQALAVARTLLGTGLDKYMEFDERTDQAIERDEERRGFLQRRENNRRSLEQDARFTRLARARRLGVYAGRLVIFQERQNTVAS